MSLLYANSVYRQNSGISVYDDNNSSHGNLKVKELMEFYGFKNVKTYYMGTDNDDGYEIGDICRKYHRKDTHKGRVALGYKNIEYHGLYKTVIGIVIRGTAEDDDWDSDFDMGGIHLKRALDTKTAVLSGKENNTIEDMVIDGSTKNSRIIDLYFNHNSVLTYGDDNIPLGYSKEYFDELKHFAYGYPDWTHDAHHAGFDIVSNRILEVVKEYYREVENHFDDDIEESDDNNQVNNVVAHTNELNKDKVCFWITGHSMGAGVANLVAAGLINGICNGNDNNVYCYTFAAPNTFYSTDNNESNYREPHGSRYRSIFNIVNEDDFVPEVPMKDCNWTKYGRTATISFNSNKSSIESVVRNKNKNLQVYYQWSITKKFINETYKGDTKTIEDIVKSFNSIFEKDYDNMRYDAYTFTEENKIVSRDFYTNPILPYNTKPFQKIDRNTHFAPSQYQMPAYFMQYIAYAMHGGFPILMWDNTDIDFGFTQFSSRYYEPRNIVRGKNSLIQSPHYLETYYLITKNISTIDFN